MRRHGPRLILLAVALSGLMSFAPSASAALGLGVRLGYSFEPEQVVVGAHARFGLIPAIDIVPSANVGFLDDAFSVALHADAQLHFLKSSPINPYVGVGADWYNFDPDGDASSSDAFGVSALGGIDLPSLPLVPHFAEVKVYLEDDLPDWQIMLGYGF